ncbi:MAG: bifunctional oligoribonuclease/PAP phosphatase NrnA [Flavobacteriales bacterium]|nr:bifunctional oligoribonuclease/PAP phosphatase NrnA [Flavobacteriales bacterium]
MEKAALDKLASFFDDPHNIVVTTHRNPDGDAMGSSLAMARYLRKKKQSVQVITPTDYPEFLKWMPGDSDVMIYSEDPEKSNDIIAKADMIICLDFNALSRIGDMEEPVRKSSAVKMMMDHHQQPELFAAFTRSVPEVGSTCQLVFEWIVEMGDRSHIDSEMAQCLYTGIMTDSGSFRFSSTSPKTHHITADLIEYGAQPHVIYDRVMDNNKESRLRLLGYALSEKLRVLPEYKTAYINLSAEELDRFQYEKGDTEGFVNYALSVEGVRFAAIIMDKDGLRKVSFRSKGNWDVNTFARNHFNGGGHVNAAGGASDLNLDETVQKFVDLLPQYRKELTGKA